MIASAEAFGMTFRFPAGDKILGPCLRDHGEFARPESDFLIDHAREAAGALLDVGANVGAISLPFAKARPGWQVLSVEAHLGLSQLLAENAAANGLTNVRAFNLAAGAQSGTADYPAVSLDQHGHFGDLGFHNTGGPTRRVGMVALDDLAPDDTRLVKIDVQGFEKEVLQGAKRLRTLVRPIWLVEAGTSVVDVISTFVADGYALFWFYSPFATPTARGDPNPMVGDPSIVALPQGVDNRWDLAPLDPAWPKHPGELGAYRYLERYGYDCG